MNLAQLQAEAREIAQRQANRLQAALDGNRDLTAEEETADQADSTRLAELQTQISAAQRLQDRLSSARTALGSLPAAPGATAPGPVEPRPRNNSSGFRTIAEFGQAVRLANPAAGGNFVMDPRLAAPTGQIGTNGDDAGAWLLPAEHRDEIVSLIYDTSDDPVFDLIAADPTASNRVTGLGSKVTPWGTTGVQAAWRVEGNQMLTSRTALEPWAVQLNELYAFVLADEDTLQDAPRLQTLLTTELAAAIRWKAADGYMRGDGVEKLQGWMGSTALVTIAKETNQTADTINTANVAKMYARMINPQQAVWLANSDVLPQLMFLKDDAGNAIWLPNFQLAPGGMLLGARWPSPSTPTPSATWATCSSSIRRATARSGSKTASPSPTASTCTSTTTCAPSAGCSASAASRCWLNRLRCRTAPTPSPTSSPWPRAPSARLSRSPPGPFPTPRKR